MSKKCLPIKTNLHLLFRRRKKTFKDYEIYYCVITPLLALGIVIIATLLYKFEIIPFILCIMLFSLILYLVLSCNFEGLHMYKSGNIVLFTRWMHFFKWDNVEKIELSFFEHIKTKHVPRVEIYLSNGRVCSYEYFKMLGGYRVLNKSNRERYIYFALELDQIEAMCEKVKHLGKFQITVTDIYHNERVLLPFGGVDGEEEAFGEVTSGETSTEGSTTDTNGEKKGIRVATAAKEEYYIDDIEETFSDKLLKIINYFAVAASIVRRVTSPGITGLPDLIFTIVCIAYIAFYIPYSIIRLNRRIRAKRLYESERLARTLLEEEQEESNEQEE